MGHSIGSHKVGHDWSDLALTHMYPTNTIGCIVLYYNRFIILFTRAYVLSHLSCVQLFATPWTVISQAPLSMGFSRQEYWSGMPYPPPGDLSNLRIKPTSLMSPALAAGFFTTEPPGRLSEVCPNAPLVNEELRVPPTFLDSRFSA